jgi:hypothetical protein
MVWVLCSQAPPRDQDWLVPSEPFPKPRHPPDAADYSEYWGIFNVSPCFTADRWA